MKRIKLLLYLVMLCVFSTSCTSLYAEKIYKGFVVNENLALEIGGAVLKDVYGEKSFSGKKLYVLDKETRFIVVLGEDFPGRGYNVSINKKDGKILKIWMDLE